MIAEAVVELSPVESAREHINELFAAEIRLCRKLMDLRAELVKAETLAGDVMLDAELAGGGKPEIALKRAQQITVKIAATEQATLAAHRQREQAVPELWQTEAADFQAQAAEKRSEAEVRDKTTNKLLSELQDFEGVRFVPERPPRPAPAMAAEGTTLLGGTPDLRVVLIPHTESLYNQASKLEKYALNRRQRRVSKKGALQCADAGKVLDTLAASDPQVLAPVAPVIVDWLEPHVSAVREKQVAEQQEPGDPVSVEIVWREGVIDSQRSRVG